MANPRTRVTVPGPEGVEPWAAAHHGRYRIPDFGEYAGYVSFRCKMSADGAYYARVSARFSEWVEADGTFSLVGTDVPVYGPSAIGAVGGDFGYHATVAFQIETPREATHWQPVIEWFEADPGAGTGSGLPPGAKVRIDDFYIPDNGYPIEAQPYLDGDQPLGRWEGGRNASTSVYGAKIPESLLNLVTIEPELLVPDGPLLDLASLTFLDDDLMI